MTSDMVERSLVAEAVAEHWGERCPDFEPGCPCCRAWAEFDQIERQAAALREIAEENIGNTAAISVYIARAALEDK